MLDIIQSISALGWTGIVLCVLTLIQISPLKIDPWSWLAKKIGNALNQDVIKKQDDFQKETQDYRKKNDEAIQNLSEKIDVGKAENARNRILRFGDEIKSKQFKHSEEYYNQILADITDYEDYCAKHPTFKNERTKMTEQIIKDSYRNHYNNNDFL